MAVFCVAVVVRCGVTCVCSVKGHVLLLLNKGLCCNECYGVLVLLQLGWFRVAVLRLCIVSHITGCF